MLQRQTRSCGSIDNNNLKMAKTSDKKKQPVSLADHNQLVQEKDALVKEIADLKDKLKVALEKKEMLQLSISNVTGESDKKDVAIEKYKGKYFNEKEKVLNMKKTVRELESEAEKVKSRIEALDKASKISEAKKDQLYDELEIHKEAFFLSKLKKERLVFETSRHKRNYSDGYNAGHHSENTASRPYQSSKHHYYRDVPNHRRR